ncbi:GNAT family N-acetyltransferase [Gammaproteobacteria bacterium]|nr:GNAT family N-acetyltransferase [Gammaproteobacteria bacterium]
MTIKNKFLENISDAPGEGLKKILGKEDSPFISFEFLDALEKSMCVGSLSGWQPKHLSVFNENKLSGFMPLYLKDNSQGEFVFDHQWSYALNRAGRNYYPKLISAIPFTPCETKKFICEGIVDEKHFINPTKDLMREENIESWHVLFPNPEIRNLLLSNDFIERSGYRFVWNNRNYSDFAHFLEIFTSRQRKNIKTERKKINSLNISFTVKDKENLEEEDWDIFYKFYKNTYSERMQAPYLNIEFFKLVHEHRSSLKPVLFFAEHDGEKIAGSLCFQGKDTLYGRHWGASKDIDSLHFECCYYQGIDYCIEKGIKFFDPGVQGEHKIRRGFEPKKSNSYHFLLRKDFREAINAFCLEETKSIDSYLAACDEYTPIKKEYRI